MANHCIICRSQVAVLETQISSLKDDLEKEHQKARAAQANYERQVAMIVITAFYSIVCSFLDHQKFLGLYAYVQ